MNPSVTLDDAGTVCSVSGTLDFNSSTAALDSLRQVIEKSPEIQINLGAVTSANSAGLALMIECKALAHRQNHKVSFSNIPKALLQLANVCEVDGLI